MRLSSTPLPTGISTESRSPFAANASSFAAEPVTRNPREGERLAKQWCAECHAVEPGGRNNELMNVPSFQAVADDPAVTEIALRAFLQTPHRGMPDFRFTPEETDGIVAYLLSLRTK